MHILIADDEAPARGELSYILETLLPEASLHEATNGNEALTTIERLPVDVVFLDIHMPGQDGLTVAATVMEGPDPPLIVFATAYDEHALRAFELAALDYVVKPFDERRLAQSVERIQQALAERATLDQRQAALREYLLRAAPQSGLSKLWGERENGNRVLVDYRDILWFEGEQKKVFLRGVGGETLLVHHTLKDLESRLPPTAFARVHKAYIVNLEHVAEVAPSFSGSYTLRMADETRSEIPMSRRYAAQLKKLTGW